MLQVESINKSPFLGPARDYALKHPPTFAILCLWARYPSGKGEVCKTFTRGFDSHPRLQPFPFRITGLRTRRFRPQALIWEHLGTKPSRDPRVSHNSVRTNVRVADYSPRAAEWGCTSATSAFFSQVTNSPGTGALNAVVRFLIRFVDGTTYSFTGEKRPACCCAA